MKKVTEKRNKGGRKPKLDPCKNRYVFYLNEIDNQKLQGMFLNSEMKEMARFLKAAIFNKPIKVIKTDMATQDYYMRLTNIYTQYKAIGVNYNQVVKAINSNFSEKRAAILLRQLEKATFELVTISKKVLELTLEYRQKYLDF